MRKQLLILAAALPVLAMAAGESVDKTLNTGASPLATIENVRGKIVIKGWDKKQVHVAGTLDEKAEELVFKADGETITILVKTPDDLGWRGEGSNLVITLPAGASIDAEGVSTDFSISGVNGEMELGSVSGDITIDGGSGETEVSAVSGDVDISGNKGEVDVETVSGDVEYRGSATRIHIESVSGDVTFANNADIDRADLETVSGDIELNTGVQSRAEVSAESVSGDIELNFSGEVNARIDVETMSGDIENSITDDKVKEGEYVGASLRTKAGSGAGRIEVETVSGSIFLKN